MQVWEAIGGKEVFRTTDCHDMLREYSDEARGVSLPNMMGDRVFNSIFAHRKQHDSNKQIHMLGNQPVSCM